MHQNNFIAFLTRIVRITPVHKHPKSFNFQSPDTTSCAYETFSLFPVIRMCKFEAKKEDFTKLQHQWNSMVSLSGYSDEEIEINRIEPFDI